LPFDGSHDAEAEPLDVAGDEQPARAATLMAAAIATPARRMRELLLLMFSFRIALLRCEAVDFDGKTSGGDAFCGMERTRPHGGFPASGWISKSYFLIGCKNASGPLVGACAAPPPAMARLW
jgi:hypothetical protein